MRASLMQSLISFFMPDVNISLNFLMIDGNWVWMVIVVALLSRDLGKKHLSSFRNLPLGFFFMLSDVLILLFKVYFPETSH